MFGVFRIVAGTPVGKSFTLVEGQTLLFGRGPETVSQFEDPSVSRHHCEVRITESKALLRDAGSATGTWVNGERVDSCQLMPGDIIRLGDTKLAFQWNTLDESQTKPESRVQPTS